MLGHILRSNEDTPALHSLKFAIYMSENYVGRQSCHQINLFNVIKNDLRIRNIYLNNQNDLIYLRKLASDKRVWRSMTITKT